MATLFSYLITMFVVIFWIFRIIVAFTATLSIDFFSQPINLELEIILLFITLICIVLIIKRNLIGSLIYLGTYSAYFGKEIYDAVISIMAKETGGVNYFSVFVSFIGIIIALLAFADISFNNSRKGSTKDKKTDWFYKGKEYERKMDDRADTNQYKIR